MSILDKVKDFAESNITKTSEFTSEESQKVGAAFSKALDKLTDLGINGVATFLKTNEGKVVVKLILKHKLQKLWLPLAVAAVFEVIGIFAIIRFTFSKR